MLHHIIGKLETLNSIFHAWFNELTNYQTNYNDRFLIVTLFPDCPANGLCCFDGCADTCVDSAPPPATPTTPAPPPIEPVVAESQVRPEQEEQEGYSYPVPDIPFELPAPSRPPPDLPTLYEVPF